MRVLTPILTLWLILLGASALAQVPIQRRDAATRTAPGAPIWGDQATCGDDTAYFQLGSANYLIPDQSRLIVHNLSATETAKVCIVGAPDITIDAATSYTVDDPDGPDGVGVCFAVPPSSSVAVDVDHGLIAGIPGIRSGVCAAPTTAARGTESEGLRVYATCGDGADCSNVGGTPSATACLTSAAAVTALLGVTREPAPGGDGQIPVRRVRGFHVAHRCTDDAPLAAEVHR